MTNQPNDPPSTSLFDSRQAARHLGISLRHIGNLKADGRLPHVRIGRSVRFRVADLEAFIESRTVRSK